MEGNLEIFKDLAQNSSCMAGNLSKNIPTTKKNNYNL